MLMFGSSLLIILCSMGFAEENQSPLGDVLDRMEQFESAFQGYSVKCEIHNRLGNPGPEGFTYTELKAEVVYYCDGDRVRSESTAETKNKSSGKVASREQTTVSNGTVVKVAKGKGFGQQGDISSQQKDVFFQGINPRNFMSRILGLRAKAYLTEEKSTRLVGEVTQDGRRLLLLETEPVANVGKQWITRVYVDPERNYQIRQTCLLFRFENSADAEWTEYITTRMSDYQQDDSGVWLPARIVHEEYATPVSPEYERKLLRRSEIALTDWEINPSLPAEMFTLDFDPGSIVEDKITGRTYKIARITDQDVADQVAYAKSVAESEETWPGRLLIVGFSVAALAFLAIFLFWNKRRFT